MPRLHVVLHVEGLERMFEELRAANVRLHSIEERLDDMPTKQDFDTLLAAVNEATNRIALKIQALIDQLAAGGLTSADEADVQAKLEAVKTQLEALGADPADPVPAPEPFPAPEDPAAAAQVSRLKR